MPARSFARRAPPGQILSLLLHQHAFELVLSPAIIGEVRRVLDYPRLKKRIALSAAGIDLWLVSLEIVAITVPGSVDVPPVAADRDDTKYLAAAVDGLAEVVVSGDDHLLSLGTFAGIRIETARIFLERLR